MKRLGILIFALAAIVVLKQTATALEVKPYISNKISYANVRTTDLKVYDADGAIMLEGSDENDNIFGDKIAAGISVPVEAIRGAIRAEIEAGFNSNAEIKPHNLAHPSEKINIKIQSKTYTLNAYYDINTGSAFVPYVGFGLGFANIHASPDYDNTVQSFGGSAKLNQFIWNAGLGAGYVLNDHITFDLGYRYTNIGTVTGYVKYDDTRTYNKEIGGKLATHEVLLGVRYTF
ncbi:MAG: outer membrane beta-barrel protein [Elusimicrobiota bacterium]|nr:outer membrane beta-barrel protein [Elusimicrobiota bacterium]